MVAFSKNHCSPSKNEKRKRKEREEETSRGPEGREENNPPTSVADVASLIEVNVTSLKDVRRATLQRGMRRMRPVALPTLPPQGTARLD